MYWNYRVVKRVAENETYYQLHEAFYDDSSPIPHSITESGIAPFGESVEDLKDGWEKMGQAFSRPLLNYEDF